MKHWQALLLKKIPYEKLLDHFPEVGRVKFECISRIYRALSAPLNLLPENGPHYLNLGAGDSKTQNPGFINIDFFGSGCDYEADLRYPLAIPSNTVSGIFSEHCLEHLSYAEVANLLAECYRIATPGCRIRLSVPDFSLFANNYAAGNDEWFKLWESRIFINSEDPLRRQRRLQSNMGSLSFIAQEYGHVSLWDFTTMQKALLKAGFSDIVKCRFNTGKDVRLLVNDASPARTEYSLYVEAEKQQI